MSLGPPRGAILTAVEMRAVEAAAFTEDKPSSHYMDKAGKAVADLVWRIAAGRDVLILCGPGNNGGDGYIAAYYLRALGADVRVIAVMPAASEGALWARDIWDGPLETLTAQTKKAPVVVDAIFGTGARGGLSSVWEADALRLLRGAERVIAVDLPSALNSDDPAIVSPFKANVTLALGALKPAHVLQPAAEACGEILLDNLGFDCASLVEMAERPHMRSPLPDDHKYTRGMVAVVEGAMPGAAALAASAAMRGGAGYVVLLGEDAPLHLPHAIVRRAASEYQALLEDRRLSALVLGPGLGRFALARVLLEKAMRQAKPLVIDGDALHLLADTDAQFSGPAIVTPHAGEFAALFGTIGGNKIERAKAAAAACNAVVIYKGADTVIAAPDGRVRVAAPGPSWLASAGTGDVLAGLCGAALARHPDDPLKAAEEAVWLHNEAARGASVALIADDLIDQLPRAVQRALL